MHWLLIFISKRPRKTLWKITVTDKAVQWQRPLLPYMQGTSSTWKHSGHSAAQRCKTELCLDLLRNMRNIAMDWIWELVWTWEKQVAILMLTKPKCGVSHTLLLMNSNGETMFCAELNMGIFSHLLKKKFEQSVRHHRVDAGVHF